MNLCSIAGGISKMDYIDLSDENIIPLMSSSSSKGNQPKWYNTKTDEFVKQQLIYQGICWRDYAVEVFASDVCTESGIGGIVQQKAVELSNGYMGCCSKNFCKTPDGKFVPLRKFVDEDYVISLFGWSKKIFDYFISVASEYGIDWNSYLSKMIILDYLFGNEDRHLNNLGFIRNADSIVEAPLFDFGLGLFEHDKRYQSKSLYRVLPMMEGKPFASDLEAAVNMILQTDNFNYCKELVKSLTINFCSTSIPSVLAREYVEYAYNNLRKKVGL